VELGDETMHPTTVAAEELGDLAKCLPSTGAPFVVVVFVWLLSQVARGDHVARRAKRRRGEVPENRDQTPRM